MRAQFRSDARAPVHPSIMAAMERANTVSPAKTIEKSKEQLSRHFGTKNVHFVLNGTAANVLVFGSLAKPHESVICSEVAHIATNECGAPERHTSCKVLQVPSTDGKITPEQAKPYLCDIGNTNRSQPKILSITQPTEYGVAYTIKEIKELATFAHKHGMFLHMDGVRLANAAAAQNVSLKAMTKDAGVDALTFGGTKNGAMFAECVVFFGNQTSDFGYAKKQGLQKIAKEHFIAAQFLALLKGNLWKKNARKANQMAKKLQRQLSTLPKVNIIHPVNANAVFISMPVQHARKLSAYATFGTWERYWNYGRKEFRFVTSYSTTEKEITTFINAARRALA